MKRLLVLVIVLAIANLFFAGTPRGRGLSRAAQAAAKQSINGYRKALVKTLNDGAALLERGKFRDAAHFKAWLTKRCQVDRDKAFRPIYRLLQQATGKKWEPRKLAQLVRQIARGL